MNVDVLGLLADLLVVDREQLGGLLPGAVSRPVRWSDDDGLDRADGAWFVVGEPAVVLLAVGPLGVTVAEPVVQWRGHTPVLEAGESLNRPMDTELWAWLQSAVATIVAIRRQRFDRCVDCREDVPPEWILDLDGDVVCHGCAERLHGVVF